MPLAIVSIFLNAMAQLTLKSLANANTSGLLAVFKHWQLYATGSFYGLSILTWYMALKALPLNVAYPLQALGYVLVTVLSWLIFSETLTWLQLVGLVIIVAGVLILAIGVTK